MLKSGVIALAILAVGLSPSLVQAQDARQRALAYQNKLFTDIAHNLGWADLATACRIRSEGWNKLIHDKATVSIFVTEEYYHMNGPSRDQVGDIMRGMAANVGKSYSCSEVTPQILSILDRVAVTP